MTVACISDILANIIKKIKQNMATQSQRAQSAVKLANHNAQYNLLMLYIAATKSGFIRKTYSYTAAVTNSVTDKLLTD